MLLMRVAQRSEEHDVGGDHPFQPGHFARLRDTRLDQREPFVASIISSDNAAPSCEL